MKHLFVPYGIAVIAKDAGFDESCFYAYCEKGGWNMYAQRHEEKTIILKTDGNPFGEVFTGKNWNNVTGTNKNKIKCSAPLYQQLTDWFREKHGIEVNIFSVLPFIYGYSFKYMDAWSKEDKSTALHLLDQVLYAEKQTVGKPINDWKELKYTYYEAYNAALIEAFKLIK